MTTPTSSAQIVVIGGGVVGAAVLHELAHRGVDAMLIEAEPDVAYAASGTNSGILHTGFDSTPGELETAMILRSAELRPAVMRALGVPVMHAGARLVPKRDSDHETVRALADNATRNGVDVEIRASDGALLVPGEHVTDPVAYTRALVASAEAAGAVVRTAARVVGMEDAGSRLHVRLADGAVIECELVVNAAGLRADDIARMIGDASFEIYARKGEFFVFELPGGTLLDHILLPVPTPRTKGVLVFPTLDGRVVAGPTAHDQDDKDDWSVRPAAAAEILPKAFAQLPALEGLTPVASYAGLRPAGRDANYIIETSTADARLINVAAIRSTGLSASLGIAERVAELAGARVAVGERRAATPTDLEPARSPWWRRTAERRAPGVEVAS